MDCPPFKDNTTKKEEEEEDLFCQEEDSSLFIQLPYPAENSTFIENVQLSKDTNTTTS